MQQRIMESGEQNPIMITTVARNFSAASLQEKLTEADLSGSCQCWGLQSGWHSEAVKLKAAESASGVVYDWTEDQKLGNRDWAKSTVEKRPEWLAASVVFDVGVATTEVIHLTKSHLMKKNGLIVATR